STSRRRERSRRPWRGSQGQPARGRGRRKGSASVTSGFLPTGPKRAATRQANPASRLSVECRREKVQWKSRKKSRGIASGGRRTEPQQAALGAVGQEVEQPVGAAAHIADAFAQVSQ